MEKKYQGTIQSNLTIPRACKGIPNGAFLYAFVQHKTDLPNGIVKKSCKSYLLSDGKPGIWYYSQDKNIFLYSYSLIYPMHKAAKDRHPGGMMIYAGGLTYNDRISDWSIVRSAHLGGIFLEETGKTSKAMKLAAEARAIVKRASYLKDAIEVGKYLGSVSQ